MTRKERIEELIKNLTKELYLGVDEGSIVDDFRYINVVSLNSLLSVQLLVGKEEAIKSKMVAISIRKRLDTKKIEKVAGRIFENR